MSKPILFGLADLVATTVPDDPTVTAPQSVKFAGLQEVGFTFDASEKELQTQSVFPDDVAITGKKITGKAKYAYIKGEALNTLVFGAGGSSTTGQLDISPDESHTPSSHVVVITPPGSGTYKKDLGVVYGDTKVRLTRVLLAATPSTGQYKVDESTGTYTFATGDTEADAGVLITYSFTHTGGKTYNLANSPLGTIPVFTIYERQNYKGNQGLWVLWSVIFKKFDWQGKNVDHVIPDLEFSAYADQSDNVASFSSPN